MLHKLHKVLLAVDFRNRFPVGRKITVGEIAKTAQMPRATAHRYMVKACGLGFVESRQFVRGKQVCYEFSVTKEGIMFLNEWQHLI